MSGLRESRHLKIPLKDIELATKNFQTCIGRGGYGPVYKGEISISGKLTTVAVKRLNEQLGQGLKEFLTEIQLLTGQNHPNLISLLGFCDEGKEKIIVYEYAERGSLNRYLTSGNADYTLTLERLRICVDAARGLDHLHNHVGKHQAIIHRDIKSANILLDENWVAKISDLGLSKLSLAGLDRSAVISHACGTLGYCEPEYIDTGIVKKESDVYSFGMVLFEVLRGRLCSFRHRPVMDLVVKELVESLEIQVEYESVKPKSSRVVEFDSDEYWEMKLPPYPEDIIKRLSPGAIYTSKKELFTLLHQGIFFDNAERFFWINNDGKKCVSISAISFLGKLYPRRVLQRDHLRFSGVAEFTCWEFLNIKCEIKTSMLSLGMMYTASLVFKFLNHPIENPKRSRLMTIKWKTDELSVDSMHTAELTPDNWYKIKMWHFINHVADADFEMVLEQLSYSEYPDRSYIFIQGIEFQPTEMMQHEEIEGFKCLSISEEEDITDDVYWGKKLPNDYQRYIQVSDKPLNYTSKNKIYSFLCAGFLGYSGKLWLSLCKSTSGICSMLSASEILSKDRDYKSLDTFSLSESRFSFREQCLLLNSCILLQFLSSLQQF